MGLASGAAYGAEDLRILARIADTRTAGVSPIARVKLVKQLGPRRFVVTLPRYEAFTRPRSP